MEDLLRFEFFYSLDHFSVFQGQFEQKLSNVFCFVFGFYKALLMGFFTGWFFDFQMSCLVCVHTHTLLFIYLDYYFLKFWISHTLMEHVIFKLFIRLCIDIGISIKSTFYCPFTTKIFFLETKIFCDVISAKYFISCSRAITFPTRKIIQEPFNWFIAKVRNLSLPL